MKTDDYHFIEKLSGNSFSESWLAGKHNSEELFVIVKINIDNLPAEQLQIIKEHAEKVSELQYTNLAKIYEVFEEENFLYIVTEKINGNNLIEYANKHKTFPEDMVLTIAMAIAGILESAYRKKQITHGNIIPENIIINHDGIVKLCGLGIPYRKHITSFSAPELKTEYKITPQSDMYSLGMVLYFMITGKTTFSENDTDNQNVDISDDTADLISRLTKTTPDKRFTDWNDVIVLIENIITKTQKTDNAVTPDKKKKIIKKQTSATSGKKGPQKIPTLFRMTAWLILFVLLAWFAYQQYTKPLLHKDTIISQITTKISTRHNPAENTKQTTVKAVPVSENIKEQLAQAILDGNIKAARKLLLEATSPETKADVENLFELVNDVYDSDLFLAKKINEQKGKKLNITFAGKERTVIPVSVENKNITVQLVESDGSIYPEEEIFNLQELTTDEKIKLLSPYTDTKASIVKLSLYLQAGRTAKARKLSYSCGELSSAFRAIIK